MNSQICTKQRDGPHHFTLMTDESWYAHCEFCMTVWDLFMLGDTQFFLQCCLNHESITKSRYVSQICTTFLPEFAELLILGGGGRGASAQLCPLPGSHTPMTFLPLWAGPMQGSFRGHDMALPQQWPKNITSGCSRCTLNGVLLTVSVSCTWLVWTWTENARVVDKAAMDRTIFVSHNLVLKPCSQTEPHVVCKERFLHKYWWIWNMKYWYKQHIYSNQAEALSLLYFLLYMYFLSRFPPPLLSLSPCAFVLCLYCMYSMNTVFCCFVYFLVYIIIYAACRHFCWF